MNIVDQKIGGDQHGSEYKPRQKKTSQTQFLVTEVQRNDHEHQPPCSAINHAKQVYEPKQGECSIDPLQSRFFCSKKTQQPKINRHNQKEIVCDVRLEYGWIAGDCIHVGGFCAKVHWINSEPDSV